MTFDSVMTIMSLFLFASNNESLRWVFEFFLFCSLIPWTIPRCFGKIQLEFSSESFEGWAVRWIDGMEVTVEVHSGDCCKVGWWGIIC